MYDCGSILRQASFSKNRCCTPKWRPFLINFVRVTSRENALLAYLRTCQILTKLSTLHLRLAEPIVPSQKLLEKRVKSSEKEERSGWLQSSLIPELKWGPLLSVVAVPGYQ